MSSKKALPKLLTPYDIGDEEMIYNYRQNLIQEKLLKCYADEIVSIISNLVVENCVACKISHCSQRQHACMMMESDEKMCMYFDEALKRVCAATIAENFMKSVEDIKPKVNGLELLKYTCKDWRTLFCVKNRHLLKKKTRLELQ